MSCIEISPEINLREVFVSFIKAVAHDCDKMLREKRIPYTDASIYILKMIIMKRISKNANNNLSNPVTRQSFRLHDVVELQNLLDPGEHGLYRRLRNGATVGNFRKPPNTS